MKIAIYIAALLFSVILQSGCRSGNTPSFIAVNQIGYAAGEVKEAFLVNETAETFFVIDTRQDNVVYEGRVSRRYPADAATGDSISVLDFTEVSSPGEYQVVIPGDQQKTSYRFHIGDHVYKETVKTLLKSYYYNRCGTPVDDGTAWDRVVCHLQDKRAPLYHNRDESRDVSGGWHDAGDHGKFSINTAYSAGMLLQLYELSPEYFTDGMLGIPESGNGIPDLLDEVKWALEWLEKMQRANGGLYHKLSQKQWVGEFLPQEDIEPRYIFQVNSNSTAAFAAVAAMASRLYAPYDTVFASRMHKKALTAWDYLQKHPVTQPLGGFRNPPDVHGGEYGDPDDADERLWAAAELYKLSGGEEYLNYFVNHYRKFNIRILPPVSWTDLHMMAFSTFLTLTVPDSYTRHQMFLLNELQGYADHILWKTRNNNYGNLLQHTEFYWGSNSVNLGYAYALIQLYRHTGLEKYGMAALNQLHYTLGRNPFNQTFVTGLGANPVNHPYYQYSMVAEHENPVPGMMVGGPNNVVHLNNRPISRWPGKNYEDREENYYVNEVAINFTAVLAYVAGFFSIRQSEKEILLTDGYPHSEAGYVPAGGSR